MGGTYSLAICLRTWKLWELAIQNIFFFNLKFCFNSKSMEKNICHIGAVNLPLFRLYPTSVVYNYPLKFDNYGFFAILTVLSSFRPEMQILFHGGNR